MTDQEINIAIANEDGWYLKYSYPVSDFATPQTTIWWLMHNGKLKEAFPWHNPVANPGPITLKNCSSSLPNYCNDLNAMHEAEKALSQEQAFKFVEFLEMLIKPNSINPWSWIWLTSHATARQRAEAFLRTKGLWRETIVEKGTE